MSCWMDFYFENLKRHAERARDLVATLSLDGQHVSCEELDDPLFALWRDTEGRQPSVDEMNKYQARDIAVRTYAFAVTSPLTIQRIAKHGPFIEVGSGTGWWAHRLRLVGCDVVATDLVPASPESYWFKTVTPYTDITTMDAEEAAASYPERTLLMVWPPMHTWCRDALAAYRGNKFVYVGEPLGGCCGCDEFFALLEEQWRPVEHIPLAVWSCTNDVCTVYERKDRG